MRRYTVFFLYSEKSFPVYARRSIIIFSSELLSFISISGSYLRRGVCLSSSRSFEGNSFAGAIISTGTELMALVGMLLNFAFEGSCTITIPFFSLMARMPRLPSDPIPERIIPILCSFRSSARECRKKSIGKRCPLSSTGLNRRNTPFDIDIVLFGGIT